MVEIKSTKEEDILFIDVVGEIDASSSIHLDNALKQALDDKEKYVAVNLEGLAYISSAGLGVFISYVEEFELAQLKAVLYGMNEAVQEVFQILGLEKLLTIVTNKEEAKSALQKVEE